MTTCYRKDLVAAITEVLDVWNDEHEYEPGLAMHAIDALGFTIGQMFAMAPDNEARQSGRQQLVAAIQAGLDERSQTIH